MVGNTQCAASSNIKVIIIDDDDDVRSLLEHSFSEKGYQTNSFRLATDALKAIETNNSSTQLEVVVSDVKMPEMSGIELVHKLKKCRTNIPVVLITAFGNIRTAVKAIQNGATDYILKPFKIPQLFEAVDRAAKLSSLEKPQEQRPFSNSELLGASQAMCNVFETIHRVSRTNANILICGESGTGKELVAQAIHGNSLRVNKPFIAINCSAIPETLLESELFGHTKGSFTGAVDYRRGLFQEADGGTVFLDEIGDMNLLLQTKLLRVIQERKVKSVGTNAYKDVDVRIISATHRDLKKEVKEGRFREDLYYRLNVIPISIPALRNRKEDIAILADHFTKKFSTLNQCNTKGLTPEALHKLMSMTWKGNVRELGNVIERAVILCGSEYISEDHIITDEDTEVDRFFELNSPEFPTLSEFEKQYIKFILRKTNGQKERAAKILGIDRKTLYRKEQSELKKPEEINPINPLHN